MQWNCTYNFVFCLISKFYATAGLLCCCYFSIVYINIIQCHTLPCALFCPHHLLSNTSNCLNCKQLCISVIHFHHLIRPCSHNVYCSTHSFNVESWSKSNLEYNFATICLALAFIKNAVLIHQCISKGSHIQMSSGSRQ